MYYVIRTYVCMYVWTYNTAQIPAMCYTHRYKHTYTYGTWVWWFCVDLMEARLQLLQVRLSRSDLPSPEQMADLNDEIKCLKRGAPWTRVPFHGLSTRVETHSSFIVLPTQQIVLLGESEIPHTMIRMYVRIYNVHL